MGQQVAICGVTSLALAAVLAGPAQAECFNCNYGLAIYVLASLAVAGVLAVLGLVLFVARKRVPRPVVVFFLLAAAPPAIIVALDWARLI